MNRSVSYVATGLLLGVFLATVGFALLLRWRADSERSVSDRGRPAKPLVLKLGHTLDTGHPVHQALEYFRQRLETHSAGSVTVDIYPSAVLGSEVQVLEQLQSGSLAMTKVSSAAMENFVPEMSLFGLPYLFRSSEHFWQVLDGEIGLRLLRAGEPKLLRGLCYYDAGARSFYTTERPVSTPEDLQGLKIRVVNSATAIEMVRTIGGAPTPIAWGELYSALAQGTVDGAENNPPSFTSNRHYEVCRHFTLDEHTRIPDILLIGTRTWERLTPTVRQWIQQAADESSSFQRGLWREATLEALETAKEEGVTIHRVDQSRFAAEVAPMLDGIVNAEIRAMVGQIRDTD